MKDILVVGAGLAGATYARCLAESGYRVCVIDKRPHVAGNAFDHTDEIGCRIHKYGPHIFHTSNNRVVDWVRRFARWRRYEHRVRARLADGRFVPFPINRTTIELTFGVELSDEEATRQFLQQQSIHTGQPTNARDYLYGKVGLQLTELFFRPYTEKMWGLALEEMSSAVVQRLPIRCDREDRYFPNDEFQALPVDGYTGFVRSILDHKNIRLALGEPFSMPYCREFLHVFTSGPIDEFYDYSFGELPYRSIKFQTTTSTGAAQSWAVTNRTDRSPVTRETDWGAMSSSTDRSVTTITEEIPCDYKENGNERFYPVKTALDSHAERYRQYAQLADTEGQHVTFIGRCGTYQYLNMDQVINQSLLGVSRWIGDNRL